MGSAARERSCEEMTPRGRETETEIIRKREKKLEKKQRTQESEREYQRSATEQNVTQL